MPARPEGSATRTSSAACTASRPPPEDCHEGRAARPRSWAPARSCSRRCGHSSILAERFGVAAEVWSAPSYQLLRNEALEVGSLEPCCIPASRRASRWSRSCSREPAVARPDRRGQRLDPAWPDSIVALGPGWLVAHAGHRRLRAQRHARGAAPLLRDRRGARRDAAMLSELARCGQIELDRVRSAPRRAGHRPRGAVLADALKVRGGSSVKSHRLIVAASALLIVLSAVTANGQSPSTASPVPGESGTPTRIGRTWWIGRTERIVVPPLRRPGSRSRSRD